MNKIKAIKAMLDGHKVWNTCLHQKYIYLTNDGTFKDDNGLLVDTNCFPKDYYEIYSEPYIKFKDLKIGDSFKLSPCQKFKTTKISNDIINTKNYRMNCISDTEDGLIPMLLNETDIVFPESKT